MARRGARRSGGRGGNPLVRIVRRTANGTPITSTTALASDDVLKWAVGASDKWLFEGLLLFNAANNAMDLKLGWSLPAGATMRWGASAAPGGSIGGWAGVSIGSFELAALTESGTALFGTPNAAGDFGVSISGILTVAATAGVANLQWAQNTSDAGALNIIADSLLRLTKLV